MRRLVVGLSVLALVVSAGAAAQHNTTGEGHITDPILPAGMTQDAEGAWGKIEFLGKLVVPDAEEELIADVAVDPDGNFAYLARWGGSACAGPEGAKGGRVENGGVYIVDIRDLENPVLVGFIRTHQDTLVGEGLQVVEITTPEFSGDVLVMNHEGCGKNYKAGVSLWDVTDPTKPKKLAEHFGDITIDGVRDVPDVNQTHSAFAWDAGDRAYLVMVDDEEATDVDIFDITNPKKPVLIAELDLNEFGVDQPELGLTSSFLHDMVVKEIDGRFIMLLSYWDGGYVLLDVTNPANPEFLGDSEFDAVDPELLEQTGTRLTPEGNAHQAEFTIDNRFVIGTDEDFAPFRVIVSSSAGTFTATPGTNVPGIEPDEPITGDAAFVGFACDAGGPIPTASETGATIAIVERGGCTFTEKVTNVQEAGYEAGIVFNNPTECDARVTMSVEGNIPFVFVGRTAGLALLGVDDPTCATAAPAIGTVAEDLTLSSVFDGWGYVHLFGVTIGSESATLTEFDTYAIPEAMDPDFAEGFGDLSVHEVAVDPLNANLSYLSYYSGGLRAIEIVEDETRCAAAGEDAPCLLEVGGFIAPLGNNFWGVETFVRNGETIILASDRDTGLWIFRDP